MPADLLLHERLTARAREKRDAVAVVDAERSFTFAELDEVSDRIATAIRATGTRPRSLVGISLRRSFRVVAAIVGVLKAGCAYVPLDPRFPADRVAFMADDADLALILSDAELPFDPGIQQLHVDDDLRVAAEAPIPAGVAPNDLAYVIYTSGSTGMPKGVCISHANVLSLFAATKRVFDFSDDDVWTLFHSYSFDFSVWEMWGALLYGGRLIIVPEDVAASPPQFLELLAANGVTILNVVPSVFKYLAAEHERGATQRFALRYVIFGGESLDVKSTRTWLDACVAQPPKLVNMYGITETTVHVTYKLLREVDLRDDRGPTPIGRPLSHLSVKLLDDKLEPVEPGQVGEIFVSGAGVAQGYLNRPVMTSERFLQVNSDGRLHYRSGDLARVRSDAELEFHGRTDSQVKIRGFRIELGEIEAALRRHDEIAEVAVVLVTSPQKEPMLVACYTPAATARKELSPAALRHYLARTLPHYMIPARFVQFRGLPLTPSGKTDRRRLAHAVLQLER